MACHLSNPEFPAGRQIVLIANDITHKAGSFGTMEDKLFSAATSMPGQGVFLASIWPQILVPGLVWRKRSRKPTRLPG